MNNIIAHPEAPQNSLHKITKIGFWVIKTALFAAAAPYAFVGLLFALLVFSASSVLDLRIAFVYLSSLEVDTWLSAVNSWHQLSLSCYALVIGIRVITCTPVNTLFDNWTKKFEVWATQWAERKNLKGNKLTFMILVPFMAAFLIFILFILITDKKSPPRKDLNVQALMFPKMDPIKIPSKPTAALTFPDGSIRSGNATISRESDESFVVTFPK